MMVMQPMANIATNPAATAPASCCSANGLLVLETDDGFRPSGRPNATG
jgi:hypothetical protein